MLRHQFGIAATLLLLGAQAGRADDAPARLCAGSADAMSDDALLRNAAKAAYPDLVERPEKPGAADEQPCVFPYQAIRYDDVTVLLTLDGTPGEACHGCGAKVSAVFLKRDKNRLTPVATHRDFTEIGTWGDLEAVTPVRWGSDDGVVIEGGGTFQGESANIIQAFVLRDGRAQAISPGPGIVISRSTCAMETDKHCTDITGTWKVDPGGRMRIAYRGRRSDGKPVSATVVYERQGNALIPVSGKPPEF